MWLHLRTTKYIILSNFQLAGAIHLVPPGTVPMAQPRPQPRPLHVQAIHLAHILKLFDHFLWLLLFWNFWDLCYPSSILKSSTWLYLSTNKIYPLVNPSIGAIQVAYLPRLSGTYSRLCSFCFLKPSISLQLSIFLDLFIYTI